MEGGHFRCISQSWALYYLMTKAQDDFPREAEAEEKPRGGRKVQPEGGRGHVTAPGAGASSGSHRGLGGPVRGECWGRGVGTGSAGRGPGDVICGATIVGDGILCGFPYLSYRMLNISPPLCTVKIKRDKSIKMCKRKMG